MSKAFDNSQLVNGNTTLREAVKKVDGSGSGLDADTLDGYHATGKDYATWPFVPVVKSSGVMEVGKYVDFHRTSGGSADYEPRLEAIDQHNLAISGQRIWHSGNDGAGSGLDADTVDGLHGKDYVAKRRDYAPYGKVITFWDGIDSQQDNVNKKLGNDVFYGVSGSATINDAQYTASTPWNQHSMVGFSGTDVTMGVPPTNYGWLDVPVSPGVHNVVFVKHINRAFWVATQAHVIDPATNTPVALLQANTNTHNNPSLSSTSSFVGPYNVQAVHRATNHAWVAYTLPKRYIDAYAVNGRIKLAMSRNTGVTSASNADVNVWVAGVAVAENPNGITSATALTLFWAQHGGGQIAWNSNDWNREILAYFPTNTVYPDIRIPALDLAEAKAAGKDIFVGVINHNNIHNDSLPTFTNNETGITYHCARDVYSKYSRSIERNIYRRVYGFVIPASDIGNIRDFNGMHYLSFTTDTTGCSDHGYIRGVYTEVLD